MIHNICPVATKIHPARTRASLKDGLKTVLHISDSIWCISHPIRHFLMQWDERGKTTAGFYQAVRMKYNSPRETSPDMFLTAGKHLDKGHIHNVTDQSIHRTQETLKGNVKCKSSHYSHVCESKKLNLVTATLKGKKNQSLLDLTTNSL